MAATALITPRAADETIQSRVVQLPVESLPLRQCVGAVLQQAVDSERDQPPFDRATMDGVAVHSHALARDIRRFKIQAVQAAGDPPLTLDAPDHAIEIMTGAALPSGCDCIIPVEQLLMAEGFAILQGTVQAAAFSNVHRRGSDAAAGRRLLAAGTVLRAPEIAVAASAGFSQLTVTRQPRVTVVSTGDELIEPGRSIADFQVRRSNVYAVGAALLRRGFLNVRDDHAADDEAELHQKLAQHLNASEVLILSGGVSKGKFDFVPKVLKQLGIEQVLHQVAQRPGKPMWFGVGPRGQLVFGLPGNPVSTLVCLIRYVIPAMRTAMGAGHSPSRVALATEVSWQPALTQFLPVSVTDDDQGRRWASPRPTNTSGDFLSLVASDGFLELPPGPRTFPPGFIAPFYRW